MREGCLPSMISFFIIDLLKALRDNFMSCSEVDNLGLFSFLFIFYIFHLLNKHKIMHPTDIKQTTSDY